MREQATALLHTPLYQEHVRLGARMVPFAGWEMPVQYTGIVEEHHAVRQRVGMFDVSHMGRFEYRGREAAALLRYVCTYDVRRLTPGEGHYTAVCRQDGGILDDVYVFRALTPSAKADTPLPPRGRGAGGEGYLLVANASNADKIRDWIAGHMSRFDARFQDRHGSTAMIAVQGPKAIDVLAGLLGDEAVRPVRPRRCGLFSWRGETVFASRTGYTGEDGMELVIDAEAGPALWRSLLEVGVQPCGLGARDTLRLEAALLLYGNDMDESVNPYEVGLGWVVSLDDGADFIGREALVRIRERGPRRLQVCLRARERGVMRAGCAILHAGKEAGKVTSGGYSPTLGASIGMGFVPVAPASEGTELSVDVRGKPLPVRVVPRPFYKRPKQ